MSILNQTLDEIISAENGSRRIRNANINKLKKNRFNSRNKSNIIQRQKAKIKRGRSLKFKNENNWKHDLYYESQNFGRRFFRNQNTGNTFQTNSLQGKRFSTSSGLQVTVGSEAGHLVRIIGLHEGVQSNDVKDIFDKYGMSICDENWFYLFLLDMVSEK